MKKILFILLTGFLLSSFSPAFNHPLLGDVTELTGYKLRHSEINLHDFNLWVVTNEEVFLRDFEPLHDSVLRPRFEEQLVLAARVETVNNVYRTKFKKTVVANGILHVYMSIRRLGSTDDTVIPLSMVTVSKDQSIRKVQFYHDNVLVKTIPIVTVY